MVLLLLACAATPTPSAPPPRPALAPAVAAMLDPPRPLVIAHRGGGALAPEETLASLRAAVAAGADVLELDLHMTSDGIIVVMHDDGVARTTEGEGLIRELDWATLSTLDAGHDHSVDGGVSFPWRGRGLRVPRLDEVLRAFPDHPFILEIKQVEPPMVEETLALLRAEGALDRVVLASFDRGVLEAVRAAPDAPATGLAMAEVVEHLFLSGEDEPPPAPFLQIPPGALGLDLLDPARVARARRLGLAIQVWSLREEAEIQAAVDAGVQGIMGPDPGRIRAVVGP